MSIYDVNGDVSSKRQEMPLYYFAAKIFLHYFESYSRLSWLCGIGDTQIRCEGCLLEILNVLVIIFQAKSPWWFSGLRALVTGNISN